MICELCKRELGFDTENNDFMKFFEELSSVIEQSVDAMGLDSNVIPAYLLFDGLPLDDNGRVRLIIKPQGGAIKWSTTIDAKKIPWTVEGDRDRASHLDCLIKSIIWDRYRGANNNERPGLYANVVSDINTGIFGSTNVGSS